MDERVFGANLIYRLQQLADNANHYNTGDYKQ